MSESRELESERERIRLLVGTLANVLQEIHDSAAAVGTTLQALQGAKAALEQAEEQLTNRSQAIVNRVEDGMKELPANTAARVLASLDGAIEKAIRDAMKPLATASVEANTAADKLNSAVRLSWAKFTLFAAAGGLLGAFAGALACLWMFWPAKT